MRYRLDNDDKQLPLGLKERKPVQLRSLDEIYAEIDHALLDQLKEDKRYERKPAAIHADVLKKWVCCFANRKPEGGLIAVGVNDDGSVQGCSALHQNQINKLEKVGTLVPDARYQTKEVEVRRNGEVDWILLFRVHYNPNKVVETNDREAYIRFGDQCRLLSDEDKRELAYEKGQAQFEQEAATSFEYPVDFDIALIRKTVERVRKERKITSGQTNEHILQTLHLGKLTQRGFQPNLACVLAFANDPARIIAGCRIHFARYDGEHIRTGEEQNLVKQQWFAGNVPTLIEESAAFVESQLRSFSRLGKDQKFYVAPEYPREVWHEAIVNACCHRSYSLRSMAIFIRMFDDRLEIQSPGGFPATITPDSIFELSNPRNPYMMNALRYLDFVQMMAEGTKRMRDSMAKAGLPRPEFSQKHEEEVNCVRVVLRNDEKQRRKYADRDVAEIVGAELAHKLDESGKRVVNFVAEYETINVQQAKDLLNLRDWHSARNRLLKLVALGILIRSGRDIPKDPKAVYILAPKRAKNGKATKKT
jgi:ATP-dependent DNA helicase RecG